jgi:hypothetical protein
MNTDCTAVWTGDRWDANGCQCDVCEPDRDDDTTVETLRTYDATDVLNED